MEETSLVECARVFATRAHEGQQRRYTLLPYITHPRNVVERLRMWNAPASALAAGWLHDVVEDCNVPLSQIETEFGSEVATLVKALTKTPYSLSSSKSVQEKRATARRALIQLLSASPLAVVIKCADRIDNLKDYDLSKLPYGYIAEAAYIYHIAINSKNFRSVETFEHALLEIASRELGDCIFQTLLKKYTYDS